MILYATRTGTLRNLRLMLLGGWRLLLNPFSDLSATEFRYGLDNGAWRAHQRGEPFDEPAFERAVARVGPGADWIVAPDIVMGGRASLALSIAWLPRLLPVNDLILIPMQDGMTSSDFIALFRVHRDRIGIFLGGSTEWKEATIRRWGRLARRLGVHYHVGRVNTARRLHLASWAEADSVDGTSASQFAETIPMLTSAARQQDLFA